PESLGTQDTDSTSCGSVRHSLAERDVAADVQTLTTLGNATRYEALRLIAASDDDVCVWELEPELAVSQDAVSQALSRLFSSGLVERRKEGRWRYYTTTQVADHLLATLDDVRSIDRD
ncbi:MAG: ArsR/SmtB family transcription factor, partial [Natronomonas sp.]